MRALLFQPDASPRTFVATDYAEPQPAAGDVLVRVRRAGICATDLEIIRGYMGFAGVLGHEFVGEVVGGDDRLRGQRVVGEINCVPPAAGVRDPELRKHWPDRTVLGIAGRDGAFADFLTLPAENCHVVPSQVSDQQAVFVEPLAAACQVVRDHPLSGDSRVALIGTGRLGLLIAQVLALSGAELLAIGRNPVTLALAQRLGINAVRSDDVALYPQHDLVVESTGSIDGLQMALRLVRPRGVIVLKSTYAQPPTIDLAPIVIHEITVAGNRCGPFDEALHLLAAGRVQVDPLVTSVYPLECGVEALAAAAARGQIKVQLDIAGTC